MLKIFWLTAILLSTSIPVRAENTFGGQITTLSNYPSVPNSDTDQLVCYMKTPNSQILNLDSLCRNKQIQPPPPPIIVSDGEHLVGFVINNSNKTINSVKVNYEVLDQNEKVIEEGFITKRQTLRPGETVSFEGLMENGGSLRITSVEGVE
jgi:hypothetical protein